mgnify:CR=1 FL=1
MQANVAGAPLGVDPGNRDAQNLPGFTNKGTLRARAVSYTHLTLPTSDLV